MSDGEEWKGESDSDDEYGFGHGLWSIWGKPMTTDQKREWRRKQAEQKAKADMLGEFLPRLNLAALCPKCGNAETKTRHCQGSESNSGSCYEHTGNHEHMHRTCKRCHYVWYEKPLGEGDA